MHVLLTRAKVASLPLSADLSLVTRRSGSFGSFARACTATRAEIEMLALWPAEALSRCLVELCSAFYWCGVICFGRQRLDDAEGHGEPLEPA